jgi:hypothetical protein
MLLLLMHVLNTNNARGLLQFEVLRATVVSTTVVLL